MTADNPGRFVSFVDGYTGGSLGGYSHTMSTDIAAALTVAGWPCVPFAMWQDSRNLNDLIAEPRPPFVLNLNMLPFDWGFDVTIGDKTQRMTIYEVLNRNFDVPVTVVMCDHPVHLMGELIKYDYGANGFNFAVLEPGDIFFLKRAGVPRDRIVHFPWGGPPPDPSPKPFADRAYDIVFHGSVGEIPNDATYLEQEANAGVPPPIGRTILRAAEAVVEQDEDVGQTFLAACASEGIDPESFSLIQFSYLVRATDVRARAIRRERFLSAFADQPVHFFGSYPDAFKRKFPRATFHGTKTFAEILEIKKDAKISLCETVNWRHNVHLRVTYAYANGCLAAAERNIRLAGDFSDMENIVFLSHPYADAGEKMREVLADPKRGQAMIDAAMPIYEERYTWRRTVAALAPFLPPAAG